MKTTTSFGCIPEAGLVAKERADRLLAVLNRIITPTLESVLRARYGESLSQACGLTVLNRSVFSRGRYHLYTECVIVIGVKVAANIRPSRTRCATGLRSWECRNDGWKKAEAKNGKSRLPDI
jgi:hypothetical protein